MSSAPQVSRTKDAWQTASNARTLRAVMALRNEEMAQRLRELREQMGNPSQELVAHHIKVGRRTYISWERAEARPSYRNLRSLADYYGVSIAYILEGTSSDPEAEASQLDRIEAMCVEIISRLDALPETGSPLLSLPPGPPPSPQESLPTKRAPAPRRSAGRD
jgi:transcriptional regulator with XRE-family HTH domain